MEDRKCKTNVGFDFERKVTSENSQEKIFSRWQIIKNLTAISVSFLLLFVAFNGLSMLQSTINQDHGIGVASQAIIYAGFCISALLIPKYFIKKFGCKRTLLLSMVCYIPYIASNFWFNWITMVPSAIIVGLAASTLWSSQCTYINNSAVIYAKRSIEAENSKKQPARQFCRNSDNTDNNVKITKDISKIVSLNCEQLKEIDVRNEQNIAELHTQTTDELNSMKYSLNDVVLISSNLKATEVNNINVAFVGTDSKIQKMKASDQIKQYSLMLNSVTARFFGFFGLVYRTSDIWGNLMSYYVLNDNSNFDNQTGNTNCSCGSSFCNAEPECFGQNLAEPSQEMRNVLTGISVTLAVLAMIIILLFLDELECEREPTKFSLDLALSTCKFIKKKEALLLFPLSAYIGLEQGFYIGDFTKSYIACPWGIYHVGLVSISYGLSAAVSAPFAGYLVKYIGRVSVMIFGGFINAAINIFLLIWNPEPDQPILFFITAAFWGVSVGILWSQLRAYYGILFKKDEEAAFAGFYLWDSIGYCLSFSYSNYLCTCIKIYVLLFVSTIGMLGYLKTEFMSCQKQKESAL